ncbi:KAP family P-loop NTPase fold protein [Flavobacterium helocola]|uniref:P-loop NTPase fold protein n=1 Tax=Flavobacterium helocola TaxID=3139139 RepID=A0ABU9I8Z9_9FLAO
MIKHNEIVDIEAENPFGKCQLDRKKYADVLTNIVSTYADGFVLAINNKWGTGKTTFIRMWNQDLKDNGFQTVLFNAWENDFENNALTALMGELKTLTKKDVVNPNFENALKNAAIFTKNLAPVLVKAVVKKYVGETYEDIAEGVGKSLGDIFEKDVNEYANKKKSIKEFRESLSKFIADTWKDKPVIFIIDELDRCRPDYAVSILEQIKHFFSIPNIVFVLSIDKEQLGHAVRGVYGSEFIDADEYLRRFIDIEYSIPEPDTVKYVKYLYNYYGYETFFRQEQRLRLHNNHYEFAEEVNNFIKITILIFKHLKISLRQQEKILSNARLSLKSFVFNSHLYPQIFVFFNIIKYTDREFYYKIRNKVLTVNELQNEFANLFKSKLTKEENTLLIKVESFLVHFYNNYYQPNGNDNLLALNVEFRLYELKIQSKFEDYSGQQSIFLKNLIYLNDQAYGSGEFLENVLNKIELLEGFKE